MLTPQKNTTPTARMNMAVGTWGCAGKKSQAASGALRRTANTVGPTPRRQAARSAAGKNVRKGWASPSQGSSSQRSTVAAATSNAAWT